MKTRILAGLLTALLITSAAALNVLAQNCPASGKGCGLWGGPPKTAEERAVRQAWCAENCPKPGPCVTGEPCGSGSGCGAGKGPMKGAGKGFRNGLRDGTGPRSATGACPMAKQAPAQK
jgi:hypothetical protein